MKKRLLSGIKSTGRVHIGNYFGAMKQFLDYQNDYESFVMIADLHSLNFIQDKEEFKKLTIDLFLDYLAIGLDPTKTTIFKQSDVPAHTELCWVFDTITTMPYLMRAHAFKDAEAKNKDISVGTFNYPILMAADILLYSPDIVPVGEDQRQHVEIARDVAQKFNNTFSEVFKIPEIVVKKEVATVPGTDGQKMSKSYKNTIPLFSSHEEIVKSVMSIPTDSKGVEEPKDPNNSIIFQINKLLLDETSAEELAAKYKNGGLGYKEAKEILIKDLENFIAPLRSRREELAKDKNKILEILKAGGEKANKVASAKMEEVREVVGVRLY